MSSSGILNNSCTISQEPSIVYYVHETLLIINLVIPTQRILFKNKRMYQECLRLMLVLSPQDRVMLVDEASQLISIVFLDEISVRFVPKDLAYKARELQKTLLRKWESLT